MKLFLKKTNTSVTTDKVTTIKLTNNGEIINDIGLKNIIILVMFKRKFI